MSTKLLNAVKKSVEVEMKVASMRRTGYTYEEIEKALALEDANK